MSNFINGWTKLFWCNFTSVWWCSESNIPHHSDDICQSFTKGFIWWIIIHHHQYKLNITASMLIARLYYQPLTKVISSSPEICGNILNIFGVGLKPPKFLYKINWDRGAGFLQGFWSNYTYQEYWDIRPQLFCVRSGLNQSYSSEYD